jgi:hypothetical protein
MPSGAIGFIYLPALVAIAAASVLTAPIGARLAHRLDMAQLRRGLRGAAVRAGRPTCSTRESPDDDRRSPRASPRPRRTLTMVSLESHPERNVIRLQLKQNIVVKDLSEAEIEELESHLVVIDCQKRDTLLQQGVREMGQYFVLDGVLKRVVSNKARRK